MQSKYSLALIVVAKRDSMSSSTIPLSPLVTWQEQLANLLTSAEELCRLLQLPPEYLQPAIRAAQQFPLRVPHPYLQRIKKGDPADPLLRQILPLGEELDFTEGFSHDPLQERSSNPVPGVIHKYHGRVLFIGANQCAIHCRYCFRRHFDYQLNTPSRAQWYGAVNYVRERTEIDEVILSGGDPLSISDKQFSWLLKQIEDIPHVDRIRIHTRLPIVVPSRVTDELLNALTFNTKKTVFVVHCNHPQEIDADVEFALNQLKNTGTTLLNQTVLLKNVNDSAITISALSKKLFQCGVLPYYLHLLDRVAGTAHFEVSEPDARTLHASLQSRLPGYLVPKMVREEPGAKQKSLII